MEIFWFFSGFLLVFKARLVVVFIHNLDISTTKMKKTVGRWYFEI